VDTLTEHTYDDSEYPVIVVVVVVVEAIRAPRCVLDRQRPRISGRSSRRNSKSWPRATSLSRLSAQTGNDRQASKSHDALGHDAK
jgi:hypothetical protein